VIVRDSALQILARGLPAGARGL